MNNSLELELDCFYFSPNQGQNSAQSTFYKNYLIQTKVHKN